MQEKVKRFTIRLIHSFFPHEFQLKEFTIKKFLDNYTLSHPKKKPKSILELKYCGFIHQ